MDHLLEEDWRTHPSLHETTREATGRDEIDPGKDYSRLELLGARLIDFHLTELAFEIEPGMTATRAKDILECINQGWIPEISQSYDLPKVLLAPTATKDILSRKTHVRTALFQAYVGRLHTNGELAIGEHPNAEGRHRTAARKFVRRLFKPIINIERDRLSAASERDAANALVPMARLVAWAEKHGKGVRAAYESEGMAPYQVFRCRLLVDGKEAEGAGDSKKEARKAAAVILVALLSIP
ncbi:hypothetical protein RQP46_001981 [Phenoliferia psychrophenolica]